MKTLVMIVALTFAAMAGAEDDCKQVVLFTPKSASLKLNDSVGEPAQIILLAERTRAQVANAAAELQLTQWYARIDEILTEHEKDLNTALSAARLAKPDASLAPGQGPRRNQSPKYHSAGAQCVGARLLKSYVGS